MTGKTLTIEAEEMTVPERAGTPDDEADSRRLSPDADDRDEDEAGYGYGV